MPDATAKIAALNDRARRTFMECRVIIAAGVQALGNVDAVLRQVQVFEAFTPDNDPYGEHDFGAIRYQGQTIFWKIDYYDLDLHMHSPDPSNETVSTCSKHYAGGGVLIRLLVKPQMHTQAEQCSSSTPKHLNTNTAKLLSSK